MPKNNPPRVYVLTGASGSGKSTTKEFFHEFSQQKPESGGFVFIPKYSTRASRGMEDEGEIISCEEIPAICKIKYEHYGERYGIPTDMIDSALSKGQNALVVVNDKGAIHDMILAGMPVTTIYVYRKPPDERDFLAREATRNAIAQTRSQEQVTKDAEKRYQKSRDIDRMRIDSPDLFDEMILNTGTLEQTRAQIFSILNGIQSEKNIKLKTLKPSFSKGKPKLFIFAGGGDNVGKDKSSISGKDLIIKSIYKTYDRKADVISKMTTRAQKTEDSDEIICKEMLDKEGNLMPNPEFDMDACDIVYERIGRMDGTKYGINTQKIRAGLASGKHQCVSITNLEVIKHLERMLGKQNIVTVYIHSYRGTRPDGNEDFAADSSEAFEIYNQNTSAFNHKFFFDGEDTDSLSNQLSNLFTNHSLPDKELKNQFAKHGPSSPVKKITNLTKQIGDKIKGKY